MNFLYNLLGKQKYQKKSGKPWTLHELLVQFSGELISLEPKLKGSSLSFSDRDDFSIVFIRNNFPPGDSMVEINGSITSSDGMFISDLFHLAKPYFGGRVRPLSIRRDEAWDGSQIQKQIREFYLPFLSELTKLPRNGITESRMNEIVVLLKDQ